MPWTAPDSMPASPNYSLETGSLAIRHAPPDLASSLSAYARKPWRERVIFALTHS